MFKPVSTNSYGRAKNKSYLDALAPDPLMEQTAQCRILRVYDSEVLQTEEIPRELAPLLVKNPGYLYAKVQLLDSRTELFLPFREPAETIYALYGNAAMIESEIKLAVIHYRNRDIQDGSIVLGRANSRPALNLIQANEVFSISALLGG